MGCQIKFEAHPIQSTLKETNMSPTKFWVVVSSIAYFHPENCGRFPFQIGWEDEFPFPVRWFFLGFSISFLEGNPQTSQTVGVSWPWSSPLESSMVFPPKTTHVFLQHSVVGKVAVPVKMVPFQGTFLNFWGYFLKTLVPSISSKSTYVEHPPWLYLYGMGGPSLYKMVISLPIS